MAIKQRSRTWQKKREIAFVQIAEERVRSWRLCAVLLSTEMMLEANIICPSRHYMDKRHVRRFLMYRVRRFSKSLRNENRRLIALEAAQDSTED